MKMTSDEHAELLMRQNNRRLRWRGFIFVIPLMLMLGIGIMQTISDPRSNAGMVLTVVALVLLLSLALMGVGLSRSVSRGRMLERLKRDPEFARLYALDVHWMPNPENEFEQTHYDEADEIDEKSKEKRKPKRG